MNLNYFRKSPCFAKNCFRPRSGNYESEFLSAFCKLQFLSVSVPARGIMNLNGSLKCCCPVRGVSVPARGIMNLNARLAILEQIHAQRFRPRSGNYESE